MKRRNFLLFSSILTLPPYLKSKELTNNKLDDFKKSFKEVRPLILAIQEHMFPKESKIPSASTMNTITFLFETITHKSYDKDIRAFVFDGAKKFQDEYTKEFISMSSKEKENILREYEKTTYGKNWLSQIMIITMEGLFSDPIYGSNTNEASWKALNSYGGLPRPKSRYIEL
jgi:hypothetical protein